MGSEEGHVLKSVPNVGGKGNDRGEDEGTAIQGKRDCARTMWWTDVSGGGTEALDITAETIIITYNKLG